MKIFLASDHAGFELKEKIKSALPGMNWQDLGTHSCDSVDYPDFADKVGREMSQIKDLNAEDRDALKGPAMAVLICGSGQGMAIRANRYPEIRAALCWNSEVAELSRQHNNANVLCLGARFLRAEQAVEIVQHFFATSFEGGRHARRVDKLSRDTGC